MTEHQCGDNNITDAYSFGSVSILVISLLSLTGAVVVPCLKNRRKHRWMQVFLALAVATLAGDAMLHLVPEVLGVHKHISHGCKHEHEHEHENEHEHNDSELTKLTQHNHHGTVISALPSTQEEHEDKHDDGESINSTEYNLHGTATSPLPTAGNKEHSPHPHGDDNQKNQKHEHQQHGVEQKPKHDHDHDHDHDNDHDHDHYHGHDHDYKKLLLFMSVVLVALYLLYMFEMITQGIAKNKENMGHHASSSWDHWQKPSVAVTGWNPTPSYSENFDDVPLDSPVHSAAKVRDAEQGHSHPDDTLKNQPVICFGLTPLALLILLGDGVHNFADGMAVGVTFAQSNMAGLSTSVAVACHELPHEIGDFAVLIGTGLPIWKALIFNLLSALTAFFGLYIGILVGNVDEVRPWVFAVAAGMFLYVAWVDMMHHLKTYKTQDHWYINLVLQNVGFVLGFVVIFLIAWFEEDIKFQ